jgi:GAF domain-containing protein
MTTEKPNSNVQIHRSKINDIRFNQLDPVLDEITELALLIGKTSSAFILLAGGEFDEIVSTAGISFEHHRYKYALGKSVITSGNLLEIADTLKDPAFKSDPYVLTPPIVRFFCGAPVRNKDGHTFGTLGLFDPRTVKLSQEQHRSLIFLSQRVARYFELKEEKNGLLA